ncbi:hypothetical protein PC122_g2251 [Phytophthora cactorum]|nr:hypothetical protein PC122_g2251 [Phytophthora cactorum]
MVANIVIHSPTTSLTRGTKSFTPTDVTLYRHCDYPGEQIFDEVRFEVSSNPIDSCYSEAYVIHRQLHVPTDKIIAWNRCRDQEDPFTGVAPVLDANSTTTPVTAPGVRQLPDLEAEPQGPGSVITVSPHMDDWHPFCAVTTTSLSDGTVTGAGAMNIKYETAQMTKPQLQAHSVDVFAGFQAQFFNPYIPYQFGRAGITAPTNAGLYFYSFALHPTPYQPSGHFNASRERELYLGYTSSFISSESGRTATFFVQAKAVNFILVSEGSCSLRYST